MFKSFKKQKKVGPKSNIVVLESNQIILYTWKISSRMER